jgi:group I intron endonuclease
MGIIYMIRNTKNDKRYVGQSVQPLEKRFRQHIEAAYLEGRRSYNTCLSRAIRKHGSDFFEVGVLAENVPDEDLDIVEAHYIDMYNTLAPNGYNKSSGFNDNSLAEEIDELASDENYSDNAKVMIDDISDDDVSKFLRDL